MTIVHLSSSLGGGGAEQMVFQLAKQSNASIKTIVISINEINTLENKFVNEGIDVHFLNVSSFKHVSLVSGLKKLNLTIKNFDNIVFHSHQYHGFVIGFLYNIFYPKKPIAFTLHSSTLESFSRRLVLFFTKPFRKKDIIFSPNATKWYLKNSVIIPNGVDFKELATSKIRNSEVSNGFSFLYLGRLSQEKNPLQMISDAKKILDHGITNFVINVVGEGNLHGELEKRIIENNLTNYFNIHGFQNDVTSFLRDSNCLILTSFWEGMPVVIIEAAACKLPVISTPVGSIPDFLNNSNAFVSDLEHFHESMIDVINNYDKALLKSDKLYNEIKSNFNIESVYKNHLHLYKQLLKQN